MKHYGLYLHFPFCVQKCHYCDFPSCAGKESLMAPYLDALLKELEAYKTHNAKYKVSTIFMGGGTPTLFDGEALVRVLDKCRECFDLDADAEVSIECNPGTVDRNKLVTLKKSGFNRLSIGLQAWQEHHLRLLGRIHSQRDFVDAVEWAKEAGFDNISSDVIFGLPNQTPEEYLTTLERAVGSGITHLSAYGLIIEEDTVFHNWLGSGKIKEADDELERDMYHQGVLLLTELGFTQYEISNFSRPGFECRHNIIYWRNGEYIGCGTGAYGYMDNVRKGNLTDIEEYISKINNGESVTAYSEDIDLDTQIFETLMLGFRLNSGINKEAFFNRFGFSVKDRYQKQLDELKDKGLIIEDKESIRPTSLGFDFQNTLALAFME